MTRPAVSGAPTTVLVVAGGMLVAVVAAAALDLPADDTAVLVALSFGVALATYAAGRLALARVRSPVVVAAIPVVAVVLGALVGRQGDVRVEPRPGGAGGRGGGRRDGRRAGGPRARPPSWRGRAAGSTRWSSASAPSSTAAASWSRG